MTQTNTDNRTEERKNRFNGESVMLTKEEAIKHDRIFVNEIGATLEDKELGYIIINTQSNKNATVEMCFQTPCNKKDSNGAYENILLLKVALD